MRNSKSVSSAAHEGLKNYVQLFGRFIARISGDSYRPKVALFFCLLLSIQ